MKAPYCISTMGELNERIGSFTHSLDNFAYKDHDKLVFESDVQDISEDLLCKMEKLHTNGSDDITKATNQLSGMFSMHTIFSKEGIGESKTAVLKHSINRSTSTVTKKPMLVELHTFPGYNAELLTPLPANLTAVAILKVVTEAQEDLDFRTVYKKTFVNFFESQLSQDVLQDVFWWFFCYKYQDVFWWFFCYKYQRNDCESDLFHRIAQNYTMLLFEWIDTRYHNILFKDYPDLMSQAVYATFCYAFPTSYRQFNSDFRDDIVAIITSWMMGIKPAPRSWQEWNFNDLEPKGLRKGEKIQEEAAKSKRFEINFHMSEEVPDSCRRSRRLSTTPLKSFRKLSVNSNISKLRANVTSDRLKPSKFLQVIDAAHAVKPDQSNNETKDNTLKVPKEGMTEQSTKQNKSPKLGNAEKSNLKKSESMEKMLKQISSVLGLAENKKKKCSCPAGNGPQFSRAVFNLFGRSPLVEHFLLSNHLVKNTGISIYVQRTEISKLPPLSAETYLDILSKKKKTSCMEKKKFMQKSKEQLKERKKCVKVWQNADKTFARCSAKLLSSPQDVKNISDLLRSAGKEDQEDNEIRSAKLRHIIEHALDDAS